MTSTGTASTQPSATRTAPFTLAAALQMQVPSAPSVTAAKPSFFPAGIEILRQQLAQPDRGEIDAEEELLRRHLALTAGRRDRHPRARPRP